MQLRPAKCREAAIAFVLLLSVLGPACSDSASARSAVLVTLDTTRVEALGCFGGRKGVTPVLDALAAESLAYDAARSVAPLTLPAHTSMMTGLFPPRHTVRDNGVRPVPRAARTLAERALEQGLQTAAFVGSSVLDSAFGLDQGFEVYGESPRLRDGVAKQERSASEVVSQALAWLEGRDRSKPFFLWVHVYDAHFPYRPEQRFLGQAGGNEYLGEVAATDHAVGELLGALRAQGALDETLLMVVADHGEGLGQHDEMNHGPFCYDSTIRVPFLLRYPDGHRAGERSLETVSVADVYPTLLEGLGLGADPDLDGLSLYRKSVPPDRGVYFEAIDGYVNYGWSALAGWADARGKYLHSSAPELFDPRQDRLEEQNLIQERAGEVERYRRAIDSVFARSVLPAEESGAIDSALLGDLRRLGYASSPEPEEGLPHPLAPTNRPSPAQRGAELAAVDEIAVLKREGRLDEAIARLGELIERYPANAVLLSHLSGLFIERQRWSEALPLFQRMVSMGVARAPVFANLGYCQEQTGEVEGAIASNRRALEFDPHNVQALGNLARLLDSKGNHAEALRFRAEIDRLAGR